MRVLDTLAYFFSITYSVGHAFAQNQTPPINGLFTINTFKGDRQMATTWIDGKRKVVTVSPSADYAPPISRQWLVSNDGSVPPRAFIQNQNQFLTVNSDGVLDLIDGPKNATTFDYFVGYPDQNSNTLAYSFLDYGSNRYIVEGGAADFRGSQLVTFDQKQDDQKPDAAWILGPQ